MTAFAEAWLLAFLLAATLGAGALAVLAAGILMQEAWVDPLRPVLVPVVRMTWLLPVLALPLAAMAGELYPWGGRKALAVGLASAAILLLWAGIGRVLARPGASRAVAGLCLMLVLLSSTIGLEDWALSRDPGWTGSLLGLALFAGGAAASLSLAVLLRGCPETDAARTGMERALLTLGVLMLWLWFVQFLTVWAADLPPEAAWYLRRQEGAWLWVKVAVAAPALMGALALAVVPQWRPWRMRIVCGLLILGHGALLVWTVRPDAALAPGAARGEPQGWLDAIVIVAVALAVLLAARVASRAGRNPV
ncbi:hypothetical protein [Roseomonas sp. WA12]